MERTIKIPSVSRCLEWRGVKPFITSYSHPLVVEGLRRWTDEGRKALQEGKSFSFSEESCIAFLEGFFSFYLQKAINATGIFLHTNLGRAPLPAHNTFFGYTTLEVDLLSCQRGNRQRVITPLLKTLFGVEDALVVNNNAAALYLFLTVHAKDKGVILSRQDILEIGGSFRIHRIMEASGAKLIEVGTVNRTRREDYHQAIEDSTAVILQVEPSNFALQGYVERPKPPELAQLAEEHGCYYFVDQGSGYLNAHRQIIKIPKPTVEDLLKAGAHGVCFSSDKLLGGPQGGIIIGKSGVIEPLRKHPLYRVLRPDKLTLGILSEVLIHYLRDQWKALPLFQRLLQSPTTLKRRGQKIIKSMKGKSLTLTLVPWEASLGGGTDPLWSLSSYALQVKHPKLSAEALQKKFLNHHPPILGVIREDHLHLAFHTLDDEEWKELEKALHAFD